jgi:hypothetical protein
MTTLTNCYRLSRHRGIPRYIDVHLRAILQVRLPIISSHLPIHKPRTHHFLQIRSLLHGLNCLWRVFIALTTHQHSSPFLLLKSYAAHPLREQNPRQHRVDPDLRTLRVRESFHQMQLRRFGHAIWQATARGNLARDAGAHYEHPTVRVSLQGRQGCAENEEWCLDVYGKAGVPVLRGWVVEVGVLREPRVSLVGG